MTSTALAYIIRIHWTIICPRVVIFSPHQRTHRTHTLYDAYRTLVRSRRARVYSPFVQTSLVRADTNSAVRRIDVVVSVRDNERVRYPVLRDQMD